MRSRKEGRAWHTWHRGERFRRDQILLDASGGAGFMEFAAHYRAVGEGIDQLVNIELTGRGIIGELSKAARAIEGDPLCLLAASRILGRVRKGNVVLMTTGLPTYPWFDGEQDGPVGTAALARAVVLAAGARPVIVTDPRNVEICAAALRGAGLYIRPVEEALRLPTTAAVLPFPHVWDEAAERSRMLLDQLRPAVLIAIERPGANEHGQYHSMAGQNLTDHCAKIDTLFEVARGEEILTIAVADGGNEIGCGVIRDTVLRVVPNAAKCACPCGGTVVPTVSTELLVTATISNWGAYGIAAAMALLLERPDVLHSHDIDARIHDLSAAAGANSNGPMPLDVGSDAVPAALHGHIVDLLAQAVRGGLDFGRFYREPRYPWF